MGVVTRGGHQYNHKRHICLHCGSGRSIKLDDYDGDDDKKPGDRAPPPTRKIDNRPLLLLAKNHVAATVEDKGSDSRTTAVTVVSSAVGDATAVGSPPASATLSNDGGSDGGSSSAGGRQRPRGRPPRTAPRTPTSAETPSSLLSLALNGEEGSKNVHQDNPALGGYSDLGSQSDYSTERDDGSFTSSRNNTHKHSSTAAVARQPILEHGAASGSASSVISSDADFKELSRPGIHSFD